MHPGYYQPAPAPVQFSPYPLGGARPVPIGIGVPGPGGTIPVRFRHLDGASRPRTLAFPPLRTPSACCVRFLSRSGSYRGLPLIKMAQAHITSPEHLHAYADYCKRTLHNAVNGNLMSKRDRLVHQARARLSLRLIPFECMPHT